ncbi:MAG: hypothetical protein ACYS22_14785 [Planctomycetota bacterium]|jgi:hypothetical protein
MQIEYDHGGRELTGEETALLESERQRMEHEFKVRFGGVRCPNEACPNHGKGVGIAVVELAEFPTVDFSFKDRCCEPMEKLLYAAAKVR